MTKKKLAKGIRQVVAGLLAGLLLVSIAGLIWANTAPAERTEEYKAYSYHQETGIDYRVHLVSNDLFGESVQSPGRAYITALTDHITADFKYRFTGTDTAKISGQYGVTATITATTGRDGDLVWEKEYALVSAQRFNVNDTGYNVKETVIIPFKEYQELAEQIREETGFNPGELNLIVKWDVSLRAEKGDDVITERMSPTITVPMRGSTFTVSGDLTDTGEGSISKTRTVPNLVTNQAQRVFPVATPSVLAVLILFLVFTSPIEKKVSPQEQKVSRILKKHKDRIVVTSAGVPQVLDNNAIAVESIEDLIRLADEVSRPILYHQAKKGRGRWHAFLVLTPERIYLYDVSEKDVSH